MMNLKRIQPADAGAGGKNYKKACPTMQKSAIVGAGPFGGRRSTIMVLDNAEWDLLFTALFEKLSLSLDYKRPGTTCSTCGSFP